LLIDDGQYYIPAQNVQLEVPIDYYAPSVSTIQAMQTASFAISTVGNTAGVVSLLSLGKSFSGFMKLTQYLQIMMYFNVQYPSNYLSFLKYFSSDVFTFIYNPFDTVEQNQETCTPPWPFMESGNSCYLLKDHGQLVMIAATLIGLKIISKIVLFATRSSPTISKYAKKVDAFLGANLVAMLLDSILFDVFLSAVLNIRALTLDIPYHTANLVLSFVCATFYLCEFAFVALYCSLRPLYNPIIAKVSKQTFLKNKIVNISNSKNLDNSDSPSSNNRLISQPENPPLAKLDLNFDSPTTQAKGIITTKTF